MVVVSLALRATFPMLLDKLVALRCVFNKSKFGPFFFTTGLFNLFLVPHGYDNV